MVRWREKKVIRWIAIIVVSLLAEFILANFSSLRLLGEEKISLINEQHISENGKFIIENTIIDERVKNIAVDLSLTKGEYADVYVVLTDQGNKYEYAMPTVRIFPRIEETKYINVYPYGEVNTFYMEVSIPEGEEAFIHEIALNQPMEVSFKLIRCLIIAAVLIIIFYKRLIPQGKIPDFNPKNKKQRIITAAVCFVTLMGAALLAKSNPKCVSEPWEHHKQYQELAQVLKKGEVMLNHWVDERLKEVENPYDTIALYVEGIDYRMDYAYYQGSYYVYFGIIPELLLYLPYHLITGESLPNYVAGTVFSLLFVLGAFWVSEQIILRYNKKLSFFHYLLLALSICSFSQVFYMVQRPDLYHIPIIAANAFTLLGIGFWLAALNEGKKEVFYLSTGSLFMALVVGCRPQMVVYSFVAVVIFWSFILKERKMFSKQGIKNTIAFLLPYGIVAIPICWYNWKRFGSVFEFGATLSLTTNDMNTRGFNWERVWNGVYSFLLQAPSTMSEFPFIGKTNLNVHYMGRNLTEFTFGGLLIVNAVVWILFYFLCIEKKKKFSKEYKRLYIVLLCSVLIIAIFDANGAGILQRYMGDLIPGITLASVLCWSYYLDRSKGDTQEKVDTYGKVSRIFVLFFILNLTYSFLMIFAQGDTVNLYDDNPLLYHQIKTYFEL